MEDNFSVRVDKVFGSLTSSSQRSLWSLTDEEVEKREWNRERGCVDREDNPCSSSFQGFFSTQNQRPKLPQNNDVDEDEEDIRSSIGLDRTLDNEEEEDEHDKIALGKEDAGDRLYMKDVTDYGPYLNSHNVLPESFQDHARDSRANLYAAKIRLKEDEKAPGSSEALENSCKEVQGTDSPPMEGGSLKSILKRKENQVDTLQKRVRFDPSCKEPSGEELESTQQSVVSSMETNTDAEDPYTLTVPDYVQNPSKYTRYTFDSASEVDDNSNRKAYMNFLNSTRSSMSIDSQQGNISESLPKSVTFIPKKKVAPDDIRKKDISNRKPNQDDAWKESMCKPPGVLAAEAQENEVCEMEEDNVETVIESKSGSSGKAGRQYRSKAQPDE